MRFLKLMPDCFEKTLVRIIYMLSLLSRKAPEPLDDILFIETKQDRLNCLKTDLEQIQAQMNTEKFEDTSTELLIKQTVQYFKTNQEIDYNFELQLNPLLTMLGKNIRPFNF